MTKKRQRVDRALERGRIFAFESMGLVDGPGIRAVVFFQGCPIRCRFCHNPESHSLSGGEEITSEALIKRLLRFRPYFKRSGGGVTFSGGEPLMQPEFLLELLRLCRENGINTCLDTSGVGKGSYEEILSLCDTVLYDVKAVDSAGYKKICGGSIEKTEKFLNALKKSNARVIVRQVVIPGINDSDSYMQALKKYIREKIPTASAVELLAYHKLGEHKYKKLLLPVPLEKTEAMDKERVQELWEKHFKDKEI